MEQDEGFVWIGVLMQSSVMLSEPGSVEAAMQSGYGAKLRKSIVVPKYQNECFLGEPVAKRSNAAGVEEERGTLTLSDVEAAYLVMKGRLALCFPDGAPCSLTQLWDAFRSRCSKFVARLKVYIFYRDQGYHVRGGINFGVDFSVYRDHPTRCHSEMCVLVLPVGPLDAAPASDSGSATGSAQEGGGGGMSWRHLSALTRVMPDVMKLMVLCYVQLTPGGPAAVGEEYSLQYMARFAVRPVTAISRRLNNRSDDFATIGNIQKKYRQLSKLVVVRKQGVDSSNKKKNRSRRKAPDDLRQKKRPRLEEVAARAAEPAGSAQEQGSGSGSSWREYFASFFS